MKHTIFTPVYNRKEGIKYLFEKIKLLDYPFDDFEWLIVDDGSSDNLKDTVQEIINERSGLNIRYFYKENGGIHTAQNYAIKNANGEYITRIDSDDFLLENALKEKDNFINKIPHELKDKVIGVVGLCLNLSDGTIRGTKFPKDEEITTGFELINKGVQGDRNYCMKTEIMRKYLIPEYKDTNWVPEGSALWLKIDRNYLTYFVNVPFSVCTEPNIDSVSGQMKKPTLSNLMSKYFGIVELLNYSKDIINQNLLLRSYVKIAYLIVVINKIYNKKISNLLFEHLKYNRDKSIIALLLPLGWVLHYIKKA